MVVLLVSRSLRNAYWWWWTKQQANHDEAANIY
jgi:hypothetical protein